MQNKSAVKTVTVKKCCVCGVDITAKKATAKTCNEKCRAKLFRKTHNKRTGKCLFCKAKFEVKNSRKLFCNKRCAESYARLQNYGKCNTLGQKFDLLKKIGLIAGVKPPKGNKKTLKLSGVKIDLHPTDCGGCIAKEPTEIAKCLELDEIMFLCKHLGVNPYKFCSKIDIIKEMLLSENYSIIETCIFDIWHTYQAPATAPEKPSENENKAVPILSFEEGIIAYQFWECSEKKKLIETLDKYREFSRL